MRHETPLAREIAREISESGPMPLDRYMALCLSHPQYGYYMTRDPFGVAGDFTTAPEISQMFGELIGLWAADMWAKLGAPDPFALVEMGPGRGTLMADALRAARVVAEFASAARVHLVETSPVLRQRQTESLGEWNGEIRWHDTLESVPPGPTIVIANELFDALPVRQAEWAQGEWRERVVVLGSDGSLSLGRGDAVRAPFHSLLGELPDGTVSEWSEARDALAAALARWLAADPGAALVIDYGHGESGFGDTLQAVRNHKPVGILEAPGECDLTAHVDFQALASAVTQAGARCHGPVDMSVFLGAIGIEQRAIRLKSGKDAAVAGEVDAALRRLTDPAGMGSLFKVLAITSPGAPAPAPFA